MTRNLPNRSIYHITHISNLAGILENGLVCDDNAGSHTAVDIGMPGIKSRRRTTPVRCDPGGTPSSYVPFYFGPRSPMLLSIKSGKVPTYLDGQDPVIYLVSRLNTIRAAGLKAVFSEGNAGAGYVEFHEDDPENLEDTIDWPLMKATWWNATSDDPYRADRRQAEYLVHGTVPIECVIDIAVRTDARRREAEEILARSNAQIKLARSNAQIKFVVRPTWYY